MASAPKARLYKVVTPPKPGGGITVEVGKSFTYGGGTEGMHSSVKAINRLGLTTNSIAIMVAKMNATFAESMKMQIDQQQELADQREEGIQKLVDQRKAEAEDIKQKEDLEQDLAGEAAQEGPPDPKEKKGFGYKAGAVIGAVSNAFGFFEGIAKFIGRIFRTMVTVAFLKWMSNPENLKKVEKVVQGVTNIGKWLLKIAGFLINMGLDGLTDFLENPLSFKGIFGIIKFLTAAAVFFAPAKMAMLGMKGVMALFKGGKLFKLIGGMLKGLMGVFKGVLGFIMARPRAALMLGAGVLAAWGLKSLFGGKKDEEDEDDPKNKKKKFSKENIDEQAQLEEDMSNYLDIHMVDGLDHPEYIKMQIRMEELEGGDKDVIDALKQKLERAEGKGKKGKVKPKKIAKGGLNLFGNKEKPKNREDNKEEKGRPQILEADKNEFFDLAKRRNQIRKSEGRKSDEYKEIDAQYKAKGKELGLKGFARGGWITGPQSGYPVSLDGGRSTSFIGHGTEYVAQKKTGGAFVVPYDTPATRGNAGLTERRTQEASNKGFSIPGFSAGGLLQDMKNGGKLKYGKNTLSDELGHTRGVVTDPEEKARIEAETLKWVNKERVEFLGLPPLKKITYADGVELTKMMGPGPKTIETSSDDMDFNTMTRSTWRSKQVGDQIIFEGSSSRLTEEDKQKYLDSNPEARMMMELKDQLEFDILGADISASAKADAGRLSAGGMVPKVEPGAGDYINIQAMAEGGEYDEGDSDGGGVSIHKGDLAPIKMGKQPDAGPPEPIFVDSKYEVPANDYFQTRYGLMAEGNTAPVEMF